MNDFQNETMCDLDLQLGLNPQLEKTRHRVVHE